MVAKNSHGEIIDIYDVSQFWPGKTEFACGFYAAAGIKYGGRPGAGPTGTAAQMEAWADDQYRSQYGSDGANMTGGVSVDDEHRLILAALPNYSDKSHYQDLVAIGPNSTQSSDIAHIKAALEQGYPIVATVLESSVFDMDLGRNPYWWGATGTHVVVYTGIAPDGNLLVKDTANVVGSLQGANTVQPGPRRYDINKIATQWATMVRMSWLPAIPSGFDPTKTVINPAPAVDNPHFDKAMQDKWNSTAQALGGTAAPYNSGISKSWVALQHDGKRLIGPPINREYTTNDWSGKSLVAQDFVGGYRCEWVSSSDYHWYGPNGEIK